MTNSKTVIIGAGFAGRQACRALRGTGEVLLLDPRSNTVMLPALPDLAGGWIQDNLLFQSLENLLPTNVRHIQATVQSIDLDKKTLLADGETIAFDQLLIAAGSVADFHGFDSPREKMYPLDSLESALRIRDDFVPYLRRAPEPHVVMAGGGYTGLELATSLYFRAQAEEIKCRVTVVDSGKELLPFLPKSKQRTVEKFLKRIGIRVINETRVTDFDGENVTAGDQQFKNVFLCWTAGSTFAIPQIKGAAERLRDGRIRVNPDLSIPGYPDVFAAGDAAAIEHNGQALRKAINFSWYAGKCAGKNIALRQRGNATKAFRPFDAGWIIPLHGESVGQLFSRIWVGGGLGLRMHYFMCGFRNYTLSNFAGFVKIAINLFKKEEKDEG